MFMEGEKVSARKEGRRGRLLIAWGGGEKRVSLSPFRKRTIGEQKIE